MNILQLLVKDKKIIKPIVHFEDYSFIAENTKKAYIKGWDCFLDYCKIHQLESLPASVETVSKFLMHKASHLSMGSLELYLSAINKMHVINGHVSFNGYLEVRNVMRGLARHNYQPSRKVKALLNTDLEKILHIIPNTIIGYRDKAVLSLGFAAALRRSEICALSYEDVEFIETNRHQMLLNIQRSKTDQLGVGYKIGIMDGNNIKPVSHLKRWLEVSNIQSGCLFRSLNRGGGIKDTPLHHSDMPRLIKHYGSLIGLDAKDYAGHSLRSGFITSATIYGARLDKIMEISRHKSTDMVMSYIRDNDRFNSHAGEKFL